MKEEITNTEILEAIHALSSANDQQFANIDRRFDEQTAEFKADIRRLENRMEHMDRKIDENSAGIRGLEKEMEHSREEHKKLFTIVKKEDERVEMLIDELEDVEVISSAAMHKLRKASPFIKPAESL